MILYKYTPMGLLQGVPTHTGSYPAPSTRVRTRLRTLVRTQCTRVRGRGAA